MRITYVGELGWELHVPTGQAALLYDALTEAGRDLGLTDAGHYAINSLRLEKGYRAWGAELTPDDTPLEAGLEFAVAWDKPVPFLGREALRRQKAAGVKRRLVLFVLQDPEPVLWGGEPIYRDGQAGRLHHVRLLRAHGRRRRRPGLRGRRGRGRCAVRPVRPLRDRRLRPALPRRRAHLRAAYDPGRQRILS